MLEQQREGGVLRAQSTQLEAGCWWKSLFFLHHRAQWLKLWALGPVVQIHLLAVCPCASYLTTLCFSSYNCYLKRNINMLTPGGEWTVSESCHVSTITPSGTGKCSINVHHYCYTCRLLVFWGQVRLMGLGGSGLGDFPQGARYQARTFPTSYEGYPQRGSRVLTDPPRETVCSSDTV